MENLSKETKDHLKKPPDHTYLPLGSARSISSIDFSYLPPVRIFASNIRCVDIHGEHNAAAHNQPSQSRNGPGPEGEDSFILKDAGGAGKAVLVVLAGLQ